MAAKWQKTEQNVVKYDPAVMPRALEGMLFISFKRIMHGKEVGGKIHAAKDASGYSLLCGGQTGKFSHDRNSGGIAFENGWFEPTFTWFTEFASHSGMPVCKKCIAAQIGTKDGKRNNSAKSRIPRKNSGNLNTARILIQPNGANCATVYWSATAINASRVYWRRLRKCTT